MNASKIQESQDNLFTNRINDIKGVFKETSFLKERINIQQRTIGGGRLIFGISDGSETGMDYEDWRFRINEKNIKAMYYERWISIPNLRGKYFLERAYFHVYKIEDEQEIEYIMLHCDANELESLYKKSPHLHIKCATYPIPKAHIALFNGRTDEVLSNLKNFHKALTESINMLKMEIINPLSDSYL